MFLPIAPLALVFLSGLVPLSEIAGPPPGTWILQVEGDSSGLRVTQATHKQFEFRAPRRFLSTYRVRLLDASGEILKSIPVDFTDFCLDPSHRGQKDHMRGDVVRPHKVVTTIKVPALPGVSEIHITKVVGKKITVLGKVDRKTVLSLAAKRQEVK